MADLIGDLLAYARAANAPLETATVDVAAAASEAAGRVGQAVAEREAEIVLPYESVLVQADERQLVQMLQNLIANAIVYCPPDRRPRVVVSARRDNGTSEIEVADNGAGIDPADRERLLRPFERGDQHTSASTGLGLAIAARVAERHGGHLQIDDNPGGGTRMRVRLPAVDGGTPSNSEA